MNELDHIIKKSIKGDIKAQRSLYDSYRTQWYMLSMRYGRNKTEAEDILQEGLIRIYRDLHQYDSARGAFSTWSSRVLVNAALRFLKKNQWQNTFSDISENNDLESQEEPIYAHIARKELTDMIRTLPLGYRVVFNMYCIEGYSHKEIADELGISLGTSKSQLFKAKKTLRTLLEKQLTGVIDG